jgi:hypothetical protein
MNPIAEEIKRRKNKIEAKPPERRLDELETSELHASTAAGFIQFLNLIPIEKRTDHTIEAMRLSQLFLNWAKERASVGWLRFKNEGSSVDNAERLRLALVRAGYEPLKGEDDPLIGAELVEAAKRVFEGKYK